MIKARKDDTRTIVTVAEYEERLRKGLPVDKIVTYAELKQKHLQGPKGRPFGGVLD